MQLRLTPAERRAHAELERALGRIDLDGVPALATITEPLAELLGLDVAVAHGYAANRDDRVECTFMYGVAGRGAAVRADMTASMAGSAVRWASYNPLCPEPEQRNVPKAFTPNFIIGHRIADTGVLARAGIGDMHQLRVLVCEEASLLAWVGGFQLSPIRPRQKALLGSATG